MKKTLITSIGRTGTVSLTHFLDSIERVSCYHEKERLDVPFLFLSQLDQFSTVTSGYLSNRDKEAAATDADFYIEVNPYFRFSDPEILDDLNWQLLYLVRHPKSYMESVYTRILFTEGDVVLGQMPDNDDPVASQWINLSRFQKLCWYYGKVHRHIIASEKEFYRFEDVISGDDTLKKLVAYIGIDTAKVADFRLMKLNSSFKNRLKAKLIALAKGSQPVPKPLDWNTLSEAELAFYKEHCVQPAKELGYVL